MPERLNTVLQVIGHFEQQDLHSFRQRARSGLGLLGSNKMIILIIQRDSFMDGTMDSHR